MIHSHTAREHTLAELVAQAQGWIKKTNTYPSWHANGKFQRLVSNYRPDKELGLAMSLFENLGTNDSLEFKITKESNLWVVNLVTDGCIVSSEGETLSIALCRAFVNGSKSAVG